MSDDNSKVVPCGDAMSAVYSGAKYRLWSSKKPGLAPYEPRLIEVHCPQKDVSVLVVGSGNGRETFGLYEAGFHNIRGVDITPPFVELANRRSRELQMDVEFTLASADRLPFPDNTFSLLTMFENIYGHITPRSTRLAALAEARRVLKPGGLLLVESTNLHEGYRFVLYFCLMDMLHVLYNPCRLGSGDKPIREAKLMNLPASALPRTHWFRPHELDAEAQEASFEIVQATTQRGILADPAANARSYHNQGRLLYVLRKRSDEVLSCESTPH